MLYDVDKKRSQPISALHTRVFTAVYVEQQQNRDPQNKKKTRRIREPVVISVASPS